MFARENLNDEPLDWYPFWLDNPVAWHTRRAMELAHCYNIRIKPQFMWLLKSEELAYTFLHKDWDCPCGKTIGPVWTMEPVNDITKKMLHVVKPWGSHKDLFKLAPVREMTLKMYPHGHSHLDAVLQNFDGPREDEALKDIRYVHSFQKSSDQCGILRALRELTQMPWLDRLRAIHELGLLKPTASKYSTTSSGQNSMLLGSLRGYFLDMYTLNVVLEEEIAALMAIANFEAIVLERKPESLSGSSKMAVKITRLVFPIVWAAVKHVNPAIVPNLSGPTLYVVFPKHYLENIKQNSNW